MSDDLNQSGQTPWRHRVVQLVKAQARAIFNLAVLGILIGVSCGTASAVFLLLLERATAMREEHPVIVYCLPVSGLLIGWIYERWGQSIKGGNNLVIDTLHTEVHTDDREESQRIPLRMAPMVLVGTVLTHFFGGSAGREGTAVQMGASLADAIGHRLRVGKETRRRLVVAGIAGGFGSVFGTPIAGALFGLEVACMGRMEYDALAPALIASVVGDFVCRHFGVVHTAYPMAEAVALTPTVLGKLIVIGMAMAAVTVCFIELTHRLTTFLSRRIPRLPVRMFCGGLLVVLMWKAMGTGDYLGLGVPTIVRAFVDPTLPAYAFAAKLLFTAVTLASGFLGGEVTPLFFVGATLGSVLARVLGLPIELGAGVGLAAVFAAAANAPIALSIMAVELLGASALPHVVIVSVVAYLLSGHRSIYPAQRIFRKKNGQSLEQSVPLRELGKPIAGRSKGRLNDS
ncbi:MAG: voltage-gated chloride channel family protein [Polyangiales bacterium]